MHVTQAVLNVLDRVSIQGSAVQLPEQLDRNDYLAVNKVLEAAGGKWNRQARAHLFDEDPTSAIESILLTGQVIDARREFGAFFSPPAVAIRVIELAELAPGMSVLEPSAGRGALAAAALLAGCMVDCVEIQPRNVEILCATAYRQVVQADFLTLPPTRIYDRVLMNPPFAGQADMRHVLHAANFVRPGGRLVAVMSPGVTFRQTQLAKDCLALFGDAAIEQLPAGSFRESGTDVNAIIVTLDA